MDKNIKWYAAIIVSFVFLLIYGMYFFTDIGQGLGDFLGNKGLNTNDQGSGGNKLPIPIILQDSNPYEGIAEFYLNVQYGRKEFIKGKPTDTLGYNGDYLGPIIKVNKKDQVTIHVKNSLNDPTTVHWHGLEVISEMDGGPHQVITPNSTWSPYFVVDQPAATLWYHPHLLHKTGEQVYKGLAGLLYIEDEVSKALNIPKEHGVNDIPLIVQDKRFTENGDAPYNLTLRDTMNGFLGNSVIVNGAFKPLLEVSNEVIRLRLVNGSNARSYNFTFSNNQEFYQISSDGGFLENSVNMRSLLLAPAERAEILIDLSNYSKGDKLSLRDDNFDLMTISIVSESNSSTIIPDKLTDIIKYNVNDVVKTREFVMSGMGPMVTINGKQMDMDRIDERVNLNKLEEWIVSNDSSGMGMMNSVAHPFHVHSVQFQIIERNGNIPPQNELGWKDTVMINHGETVKLLVKFKYKGMFMYHCHILEHEDAGMMGQFLVE